MRKYKPSGLQTSLSPRGCWSRRRQN